MPDLNPIAVERELQRLSALLEERTEELAKASRVAAEAEVAHKRAEAFAVLEAAKMAGNGRDGRTTVDEREAHAFIACADEYEARLLTGAARDSCQESCRTIRAQLSALQSIGATLRELVTR